MAENRSLLLRGISIHWDEIDSGSYLQNIPALRSCSQLYFSSPVTLFSGENGSGKSTLLEGIAVAFGFNPEGGNIHYSFSTRDSHSELHNAIRLSRGTRKAKWGYFLRAESFYNVATMEEEYSKGPGGIPQHFHEKSHGESFLALVQNNFTGGGIFFLDEPEAALSPQRQLSLLIEIHRCAKEGAQFFIATHSPILLGIPDAEILSFDDGAITETAYEDTGSYRITSMFINGRERFLSHLLAPEE